MAIGLLFFSNKLFSQTGKLVVEGSIQIEDSESPNPTKGTIRYNETTNDFEGWNGVFWASLTGYQLGSVIDGSGITYNTMSLLEFYTS